MIFHSIASIFEAWAKRRNSPHTQRAYRAGRDGVRVVHGYPVAR